MVDFDTKIDIPTFILDSIAILLKTITDKNLVVTIRFGKRSLDSNRYYWRLVGKLSSLLGNSKSRQHNLLLRSYGVLEEIEGKLLRIPIPDTDKAEETALEASEYHLKPTSSVKVGTDGVTYRTYVMLRGSSDFDTKEMSDLIKGTIDECRQIGIPDSEIMTPKEKEQLEKMYGVRF